MTESTTPTPPASPAPRKAGGRLFFGVLAVAAVASAAMMFMGGPKPPAESTIVWQHVENRAGLESNTSGKPGLLFFTADWCGPCKILKSKTLTDTKVSALIESRFTPMKIDLTDQNSPGQLIAHDYKVDGIPTLIIVSAGKEVDRTVGVLDAAELNDWLSKGLAQTPRQTAP
jgi:thiol:disulfide interchange protein